MTKFYIACFLLSAITLAHAAAPKGKFVHSAPLPSEGTDAAVLDLAANIVPSPRQMAYHEEEFTGFIHFGPNTFTGVEWGNGMEDPKVFAPKQVDTDQWCEIMKAAGIKKLIITVKHHDGYNTWQTRYNKDFSVHQSPWKNGKGDVLRLLADSCKKYDLKLGVYLSPADLYQIESKTGLYGDGSKYKDSVIPTDPARFKSNPTQQRKVPKDWPTFRLETDHYNRYFMNQLYELLTEYGPIHEVWFDGAHPKRKGGQTYLKEEWYNMIRKLMPEAVIFGGPDVRWCGNEHGGTRTSEWSVLPVSSMAESGVDRPAENIGYDASLLDDSYEIYGKTYTSTMLMYMISEVDVSIRNGWFWRNDHEQRVRSVSDVLDMYERTVGGNAVFLLNVPPNRDGRIGVEDEKVLREVGRRINTTYGVNLAEGCSSDAQGLDDGNIETYWQSEDETGSFTVQLAAPKTVNRVVLQEAISKVGQRVKEHALDAYVGGDWQEIATGTTIGYKKILRFPDVTADRFRVRILASRAQPSIAHFSAHHSAQPPQPVSIKRNAEGQVLLESRGSSHTSGTVQKIYYTLDGSEPTQASKLFHHPFALPNGGTVKARSIVGERRGAVSTTRLGLSSAGWKASASSEHDGYGVQNAIDGNAQTFWHTSWANGHPAHPHTLTIDLGAPAKISGFTYLPRQDKRIPDSMVAAWRIEGSPDGKRWKKLAEGEFGNIMNDPSQRVVNFKIPATIRYFRFISLRGVEGKPYAGAAEIELLSD